MGQLMENADGLRFKWYIFDMDGTILDSSIAIGTGVQYALKSLGINDVTLNNVKRWIGRPLYEIWAGYCSEYGIEIDLNEQRLDELAQLYLKGHYSVFDEGIQVYPGILEFTENLRSKGAKVAIATTKWQKSAEEVMNGINITSYFDVICGTDPDKPVKPDPYVINYAMQELGASPDQSVVIGDTTADIDAAHMAGCKGAAVTYGFGKKTDLERTKPDFWIDKVDDLYLMAGLPNNS